MSPEAFALLGTAATLGVTHTAIGVDHTVPFVLVGKAQGWSLRRTLGMTTLCGAGHVLSSVLVGALGFLLGLGTKELGGIQAQRGTWASWALILFGVAYAGYGAWRVRSGRRHRHLDRRLAPAGTALFLVFLVGPCEALIPLMMAPAWLGFSSGPWLVALVFGVATLVTMVALVTTGYLGLGSNRLGRLEPHLGWLAGVTIAASGLAIQWLGI